MKMNFCENIQEKKLQMCLTHMKENIKIFWSAKWSWKNSNKWYMTNDSWSVTGGYKHVMLWLNSLAQHLTQTFPHVNVDTKISLKWLYTFTYSTGRQ